jgi:hypothetical protein
MACLLRDKRNVDHTKVGKMLINDTQQFIKTQFDSEAEIESVVQKYAERLFGSSIIYLPQTKISTLGGRNTVPDAIVIDVESQEWFVVEAERAAHGTWEHIAPQVSRQLAAVGSAKTREAVLQIALSLIAQRKALRVLFQDLGIGELEIHGRINNILQKTPTIAIPIDGIPKDLKEWAQTLKNNVKIWLIEKYVPVKGSGAVLYSIPDENLPTISTTPGQGDNFPTVTTTGSQPFQELLNAFPTLEGEPVFLEYGPHGKPKQTFEGTIKKEGVEVDGKVYSPSYAAVYCIQEAGSPRKTANGWIMLRTRDGTYLNALYKQIGEETEESEESLAPTDKIDVWEETTP